MKKYFVSDVYTQEDFSDVDVFVLEITPEIVARFEKTVEQVKNLKSFMPDLNYVVLGIRLGNFYEATDDFSDSKLSEDISGGEYSIVEGEIEGLDLDNSIENEDLQDVHIWSNGSLYFTCTTDGGAIFESQGITIEELAKAIAE